MHTLKCYVKGGRRMSKPKAYTTPGTAPEQHEHKRDNNKQGQEPLSGSKKVKNSNHVDHHNPQG
jgi:small acid-soluble spore protein P (minor)